MLLVSTLLAVIYGIINDTDCRWISEMTYAQLYGTIGTARIGMFYFAKFNLSCVLYKEQHRIGLSLLLTILVFTLSTQLLFVLIFGLLY